MLRRGSSWCLGLALALLSLGLGATGALGATYKVVHNFGATTADGSYPEAGLTLDAKGNLYGTTEEGGPGGYPGCGTVFELSPSNGGEWTKQVLYNPDGCYPEAPVILDAKGNLYGTTTTGGGGYGNGTVFKLSPACDGTWTNTIIWGFPQDTDGRTPLGSLAFDSAGNLYGTTLEGGADRTGAAFEIGSGPGHPASVIYSFRGFPYLEAFPYGGLVSDAAGNLYGTAEVGGRLNLGVVFKLTPKEGGTWTYRAIHSFGYSPDGSSPVTGVTVDAAGNVYGMTNEGGDAGYGAVYQLSPRPNGSYSWKVLHSFNTHANGGRGSTGEVAFDKSGNLWGTTTYGSPAGGGEIFKLTPTEHGYWRTEVVHDFGGGSDGSQPQGNLVIDAHGNVFGVTSNGGLYGYGTVFEIER